MPGEHNPHLKKKKTEHHHYTWNELKNDTLLKSLYEKRLEHNLEQKGPSGKHHPIETSSDVDTTEWEELVHYYKL